MSDVADMAVASMPSRQRPRPHDNEGDASATDRPQDGGGKGVDVILSLRDGRYKDVMWEQFNILGSSANIEREENVALEVWKQFKKEGAIFYCEESGGRMLRLEDGEALEKIKRDVKCRVESIDSWESAASNNDLISEVPSVSEDLSESSCEKRAAVEEEMKCPPSPMEYVDSNQVMHPSTSPEPEQLSNMESQAPEHQMHIEDANAKSDTAKLPPSSITLGGTPSIDIEPNEKDAVISLSNPKYREALTKCFLEWKKGHSKARDLGREIVFTLKSGGGRLLKVERGSKIYVELDESAALQKIVGDIGRRRALVKRWKLDNPNSNEEANLSSSVVGNDTADEQVAQGTSLPRNEEANIFATHSSQVIDPQETQWNHSMSTFQESATSPGFSQQSTEPEQTSISLVAQSNHCLEYPALFQMEEKKQDDHDHDLDSPSLFKYGPGRGVEPLNATANPGADLEIDSLGVKPEAVHNTGSPGECQVEMPTDQRKKGNCDLESPSAVNPDTHLDGGPFAATKHDADPEVDSSSTMKPIDAPNVQSCVETCVLDQGLLREESDKKVKTSTEIGEMSPVHVILSLNDDYYKNTMWTYYRMLGNAKNSERENQLGNEILSIFQQRMGKSGKFFKRMHGQDFEVNDKIALAKILADIGRRHKSYQKWSKSPEGKSPKTARSGQHTPNSAPLREKTPSPSAARTARGHSAKLSTSDNEISVTKTTPRRSTRKQTPNEGTRSNVEPDNRDIVLSLYDERYKEIMWREYNILGKKQGREEGAAEELFQTLKKSLGRGGRFWKRVLQGDQLYMVDDEEAFEKIVRDLKRRNESIKKWLRKDSGKQMQNHSVQPHDQASAVYHPSAITKQHAWRDQLVPSPIELPTASHTQGLNEEKPPSTSAGDIQPATGFLLGPNHAHESASKSNHSKDTSPKPSHLHRFICHQLPTSHLGQCLPPSKSTPSIKLVQTPNQLIQILQHATHKLNELHGTKVKHCKVLRLYDLHELSGESKSLGFKAPSLAKLAEFMETTPKSLKRWYTMYQTAMLTGFNFEKFGDDKIKDHYGSFHVGDDYYQISKCGERIMTKSLEKLGKRVVNDAKKAKILDTRGTGSNSSEGAARGNSTQHNNVLIEKQGAQTHQTKDVTPHTEFAQTRTSSVDDIGIDVLSDRNPFPRYFEMNQARLLELQSKNDEDLNNMLTGIQLDSTAKRVKKGDKGRVLCMVSGCEKHAQTRCDGCCTSHFRILSTSTGSSTKNTSKAKAKADSASVLGKRKVRESIAEVPLSKDYSKLSKLEDGSRIYVEWDADNNLYKATVKKLFFDREVPMVKLHYDGKKRHILDTIPLKMVKSFIKGENQFNEIHGGSSFNFSLLDKHYPVIVPLGKNKITLPCPELGSGWQVYIAVRRGLLDGSHTERFFVSPTGRQFGSVSEVERCFWENPDKFDGISGDTRKYLLHSMNEGLNEECEEISAINQSHLGKQPESNLSTKAQIGSMFNGMRSSQRGSRFTGIRSPQDGSKFSDTRSLITISPITIEQSAERHQLPAQLNVTKENVVMEQKISKLSPTLHGQAPNSSSVESGPSTSFLPCLKPPGIDETTIENGVQSPKEVTEMNIGVLSHNLSTNSASNKNSAFASPRMAVRQPLRHKLYQTSPTTTNRTHFPRTRAANSERGEIAVGPALTRSNRVDDQNDETCKGRPKRKLKPITRFDEEEIPSSRSVAPKAVQSKSVLCHCAECDKGNLSVQGIYAHQGRAHKGNLSWQKVTFSCPFCPPCSRSTSSHIFESFYDIEEHVSTSHPGCEVVGPHPSKLLGKSRVATKTSPKVASKTGHDMVPKSDRVLRERKAIPEQQADVIEHEIHAKATTVVTEEQGSEFWTEIDFQKLLPDGRKDYSRDLSRVIDMVDEQCEAQEEVVEVAREQRVKLCKNESELESRALDEERLSYQRGIRERTRLADGERIEKQKFNEKAEQMMIRFEYENRNKRRNQEEVEVERLCSRPIRFSDETQRPSTRQGKACKDDQCQFCKKDNGYLHHLLLDSEVIKFRMDAPATESPVFQKSTKVLNPAFGIINDNYFAEVEAAIDVKDDGKDVSGSKRVNQSRRDASTAKRLRTEEDKLLMLKNTKHSLEFIQKYNNGMIKNAWGEPRKDNRGYRKSY